MTSCPYLHLLKRNLEAEGLVVVWIQSVLLHCRLLLLQPLAILQEVNFHVGIWRKRAEILINLINMPSTCMSGLQSCNAPTDGANAEARGSESWCMVSTAASAREQSRKDLMVVLAGMLLYYTAVPLQPSKFHINLIKVSIFVKLWRLK